MTVVNQRTRKEHLLMPYRVREVLLLSTRYDHFVLEADGFLTEQVFLEYRSLHLSSAPRFHHYSHSEAALEALGGRHFDLVLAVAREATPSLVEFGRKVKENNPNVPVVVLGFETADLTVIDRPENRDAIDATFIWNGDAKIMLAIIKHIEDLYNVDNDTKVVGVRVILFVEDSIRYFSSFLATLYPELMKQSQSLFSEGFNRLQRLLRMRTRPKILHAKSFEEAIRLYDKYGEYLIAMISDVGFPRDGVLDPEAGLHLTELVRKHAQDLPILLQSADHAGLHRAEDLRVLFVDKHSPALLWTLKHFLKGYLGFGSFTFRAPDGYVVAEANDIREFAECIKKIPAESLEYHTRRNHISHWLMARSEFEMAQALRRYQPEDFDSIEDIRDFISESLHAMLTRSKQGVISDFSRSTFDRESRFLRVGDGSLGGKARGIAFLNHLLTYELPDGRAAGLQTRIPQTFVITTEGFESFLERNDLSDIVRHPPSDADIIDRFLKAPLPEEVTSSLEAIVNYTEAPLAVRSSSLLEDDMSHPFAGIYATIMIPNSAENPHTRVQDLANAIRMVYASTFFEDARSYLENTAHSIEEERMAVVIQQVVGQRYGDRFYPHFSGVAHSYNYYPVGLLTADEGVVQAVLGLGRMVVDGGETFRFGPKHPEVTPQISSPTLALKSSQRQFYTMNLSKPWDQNDHFDSNQELCDLTVAREDGTFAVVGSVYDVQNDVITESPNLKGPLLVTFNNLLKHRAIPFAPAMDELLSMITEGMGTPVEVEFACNMGDWGRKVRRGQKRQEPTLYILQVRPIQIRDNACEIRIDEVAPDRVICRSDLALGVGDFSNIQDVVYVDPRSFDPAATREIAAEVGELNSTLVSEGRPYVLIGPGRWGSSDHWLGIPVGWSQISGARIIVEASPDWFNVEPSQGSHFFHNITALHLGYFTIPPGSTKRSPKEDGFIDWNWLAERDLAISTAHLRHVRTERPLAVHVDGRKGIGLIAWCLPETENDELEVCLE